MVIALQKPPFKKSGETVCGLRGGGGAKIIPNTLTSGRINVFNFKAIAYSFKYGRLSS
jgi:hypothetical protein